MNSYFQEIVARVSKLKPGERITANSHVLGNGWGGVLGSFLSNGFTPSDRVLENVIGSSKTHRYTTDRNGDVTFYRLHSELPEGVRSYVSPDRTDYFDRRYDGLYQLHETRLTQDDESRIICALRGHQWVTAWVMPERQPMLICAYMTEIAEETVQLIEGKRCRHCMLTG